MKRIVGRIFKEIVSNSMQMFQFISRFILDELFRNIWTEMCEGEKKPFFGKKSDSML